MNVRVTESFTSWQGTGHLAGTHQHFIRFAGCSVKACPIRRVCDEPEALRAQAGRELPVASVALEAWREVGSGGWVQVTGGEPMDQLPALEALLKECYRHNLKVHLQTSGTRPVELPWDWITVSPKTGPDDLQQTFGQEMVLVYQGQTVDELRAYARRTRFWFYYLVPRWENGAPVDVDAMLATAAATRNSEVRWAVTSQMHKYLGAR